MNRLLELQRVAGEEPSSSAFSPTGAAAPSIVVPPSAMTPVNDSSSNVKPSATAAESDDPYATNMAADYQKSKLSDDDDDDDNGEKKPSGDGGWLDAAKTSVTAAVSSRVQEYTIQHDDELDKAIKLIEDIASDNRKIQASTIELRNKTAENMKNFNPAADAEEEGTDSIDSIMDKVSAASKHIKENLDKLAEETKLLTVDEETAAAHAGTVKIQQNQHAHLTRQFMQSINEYNAAVTDNEKQLREQAVHRIKIKYTKSDGTTVSDEEAREMAQQVLEFGQSDMLFQASKEVLNQVLETRQDILRIERSMRDLKQIMDDLSSLITEQGEILDQVLTNVEDSVKYVQSGREKLKAARESAKSASSKMKYAAACFCVLFLIILASTLGATIPT